MQNKIIHILLTYILFFLVWNSFKSVLKLKNQCVETLVFLSLTDQKYMSHVTSTI